MRNACALLLVSCCLPACAATSEIVEGVEIRSGEAVSEKGYRVRMYTSRPRGATGRLPLVVFIPWLSCDRVDNPRNSPDGWSDMLRVVMRESGAQLVRIEKPGVAGSEGPGCAQSDLEDDMVAFRAGIRAAIADPGADPSKLVLFGGSVGMALAPILAQEFNPCAIVGAGGFTRTWFEHMLDIERRRLTLSGKPPHEVNEGMKKFAARYWDALQTGNPFPEHQYGRHIRYYQQLQGLDVEGAWHKVSAPTLIVWGEFDWIMGRDESDRAAAILGSKATYVVRRGMNHHFETFGDARSAFEEKGGRFDEGAARQIASWLRARTR